MRYERDKANAELGYIPAAFAVWFVSALCLVLVMSIILTETGCRERGIAYASSFISFVSAFFAGAFSAKKGSGTMLGKALISATTLIILLLTIGFLINGEGIEASSVLSLVSFTYAGFILGCVMFSSFSTKRKHYKPRI